MADLVASLVFLALAGAAGVVIYAWYVDEVVCRWREARAARRSPPGRRRGRRR